MADQMELDEEAALSSSNVVSSGDKKRFEVKKVKSYFDSLICEYYAYLLFCFFLVECSCIMGMG